ncbi:MAG: hypothetical protein IPI17_00015 [Nitrosomonas sp.]|nr:hypothetical protein [Nitrosomonas sp.]
MQAQNELKLLEAKNQALKLELAHLRRIRFGAKSEALSQPQFSLFEEDWQTDVAAIEAEIEQLLLPVPQKTKRARAGRQPLPDHLPRIEHRHEPQSCQCRQCGSDLIKIGEDVTEQLDVKPGRILRAPPHPPGNTPAVLAKPWSRNRATCRHQRRYRNTRTPCLDHYSKYLDHLPHYRTRKSPPAKM